jgi:hypothetical protein
MLFLLHRHICTLNMRIDSRSSRGRESMAGEIVLQRRSCERRKLARKSVRIKARAKQLKTEGGASSGIHSLETLIAAELLAS